MATLSPKSAEGSQAIEKQADIAPKWPFTSACFDPVLDDENDVADAFKDIENGHLAKSTSLHAFLITAKYSGKSHPRPSDPVSLFCVNNISHESIREAQESALDDELATALLLSRCHDNGPPGLELFVISKLASPGNAQSSAARNEHGKLQVTKQTFRLLLSTFDVPVAFVSALARPYMVCGTGFRSITPHAWDHWCLIPVRTVAPCRVQAKDHTKSTAGSNQLDPFHYIHLSGAKADIRGSYIGLFIRHRPLAGKTTVVSFNLLDSRLKELIEEPIRRTRAAVRQWSGMGSQTISPRFIHIIYLSSTLRWWNNVLLCFNQQLVMHEKQLQQETAADTSAFSTESKDINTSLHIMAAHLHRYKSELDRINSILSELGSSKFVSLDPNNEEGTGTAILGAQQDDLKIEQLMSQLTSIIAFSDELERKVQNILTLLFNQIQVTNDRTMQAILTAAQQDNKLSQTLAFESHELSQSMKNDSVAMKTIAVLTMLFLPGTSFAAIFAMPFFTQTPYLSSPAQIWIWAVLTAIVTLLAFGLFSRIIKRQEGNAQLDGDRTQDEKSAGVGKCIPLSGLPPSNSAAGC